jgi:phage terminase small subunit
VTTPTTELKKLTLKQEMFIAAYLGEAHGNATEAARIAGYKQPQVQGPRLLHNVAISARVSEHVERAIASADAVLHELASVGFAPWHDFVEVVGRAKDGEATKVRSDIQSKVKALELLGKYHQLFTEKQVVDVNIREHFRAVPQSTLERITRPAERRADA